MQINLIHTAYNQKFGRSWDEVYDLLYFSLIDLGHFVERCVNKTMPRKADLNIIVGWHSDGSWMSLDPKKTIVVQLENFRTGILSGHKSTIVEHLGEYIVWDYSHKNILEYPEGVNVHHMKLGYHSCLDYFSPKRTPSHDIVFYGSLTPRRKEVLDKLSRWHEIVAVGNVWGGKVDQLISDAKIVLNIGSVQDRPLETPRLAYCLNNGCLVVSEESGDVHDDSWWSNYVRMVPAEMLSHNIYEMLETNSYKDLRHENLTKYMDCTSMKEIVEELLEASMSKK